MKRSKFYTILIAILSALIILSGSIAVPILARPFYYSQIESLNLEENTGLSRDEIITAYDEMLDFCLGKGEFSTGVLEWSENGKSHFEDVKSLFLLDLRILCGSTIVLIIAVFVARKRKIKTAFLLHRGALFWTGAGLGGISLIIAGIASMDFDRTFEIFHAIFFPGKSNWLFDPDVDQIITILPEEFFMNCGILIAVLILVSCIALILLDFILAHRRKYQEGRSLKQRSSS